jgi:hypothetical protein
MGTGVSAGAFVVLAAITLTMAWKKHRPRWVAIFAAATGLAGATPILGWLGGLASAQILGAGIATVISIVGAIIMWHEVVKNNGRHKVRTPVVAFIWAVALMAVGGAAGHAAHQFSHGIISTVDKVTPNGTNG